MISYIPIIISLLLAVFCAFSLYRNLKLKLEARFLGEALQDYKEHNLTLEEQRIEHIQRIEQLSENLKYQENIINEFKKLKEESKESTKAVLFDLGSQLSKQLIEIHKKENRSEERRVGKECRERRVT